MSFLETTDFALQASMSLFNDKPTYASVRRRPILFELSSTPPKEPLNREEELIGKFLTIIQNRGIRGVSLKNRRYWNQNLPYDLTEVFGTCVQFIDQHTAVLPKTTLPPAEHIEAFINKMFRQSGPVTIDKQFEMLLDLSGNNVVGAANIGMLATRYMSRFSDIRAYPKINIEGTIVTPDTTDEIINQLMKVWNTKVARFETCNQGRNDGTGDQYYFWTHFFAACVSGDNTLSGIVFQKTFERGNEIMIFVKDRLAKRGGVVSNHFEASLIGRNVGLAISYRDAELEEKSSLLAFQLRKRSNDV